MGALSIIFDRKKTFYLFFGCVLTIFTDQVLTSIDLLSPYHFIYPVCVMLGWLLVAYVIYDLYYGTKEFCNQQKCKRKVIEQYKVYDRLTLAEAQFFDENFVEARENLRADHIAVTVLTPRAKRVADNLVDKKVITLIQLNAPSTGKNTYSINASFRIWYGHHGETFDKLKNGLRVGYKFYGWPFFNATFAGEPLALWHYIFKIRPPKT